MNLHCVYLAYEPQKEASFRNLVRWLGRDFKKVNFYVVKNNPMVEFSGDVVISGDNSCYEFSGYECAFIYLNNSNLVTHDDCVIFCNDTWDNHRYFSILDKFFFRNCIKSSSKSEIPCIFGRVDSLGFEFPKSWISTYFFGVNYAAYKKIKSFIPENILDTTEILVLSKVVRNIIFSNTAVCNFNTKERSAYVARKSKTILAEFAFSLSMDRSGVYLKDVYRNYSVVKYLTHFAFKSINKFKNNCK